MRSDYGVNGTRDLIALDVAMMTRCSKMIAQAGKVGRARMHTRAKGCKGIAVGASIRVANISKAIFIDVFLIRIVHSLTIIIPILYTVIIVIVVPKITRTISVGI